MVDGLDELHDSASMAAFHKMMESVGQNQVITDTLDPAIYLECFTTQAGQLVLADMYARYVNVTIVEPGAARETHGIRQGQANVVFEIVHMIEQYMKGEDDGES